MKEPPFEEIINELEKIVGELDSSLGLEEALKKYERGMILANQAENRLKTIENQFEKISQKFDVAQADEELSGEEIDEELPE